MKEINTNKKNKNKKYTLQFKHKVVLHYFSMKNPSKKECTRVFGIDKSNVRLWINKFE